ncbi:MAG TPA: hypothetical protein VLY63_10850 [Anaerolineae bacterium]|nr:hypothetical protein [Anaerolineae bacterium]
MAQKTEHLVQHELRTPRAAAIAGILFALLYGTSWILIRLAVPADSLQAGDWLDRQAKNLSLAMSLIPFAGISFLWFMGVVRDRMGRQEDQFFSTLFSGSGYLYLAMTFASAAMAAGVLVLYALDPGLPDDTRIYSLALVVSNRLNTVYAMRMAGAFMTVLGTIWVRTGVMPRWLALVTYLLAAVLLISIGFTPWVILVFPAWVFAISVTVLVLNYRRTHDDEVSDGLTLVD